MQSSLLSGLLAIVAPASAAEIPSYEVMFSSKKIPADTSLDYIYIFLKIDKTYYGIIDDGSDGTIERIARYDVTGHCSLEYMPLFNIPTMEIPEPKRVDIFTVDPPLSEWYIQTPRDTSAYAQKEAAVLKEVYADFLKQGAAITIFQEHSHYEGIGRFTNLDIIPNVHHSGEPDWDYWTRDPTREFSLPFFTQIFLGFSDSSFPVLVSLDDANKERGTLNIKPLLFNPEKHRMIHLLHDSFRYGVTPSFFAESFPDIVDALQLRGPFLVDARVFPQGKIPESYASRFETITPVKGLCNGYYLEK